MSQLQSTAKSRWNPNQVRRCVRFQQETNDGIAIFTTKSFTSADQSDKYHPACDLVTGEVTCDCNDHIYRRARLHPTVETPENCCKHARRMIDNLKRHSEIQ